MKSVKVFFVPFLSAFFLWGSQECFSDESRDGLFTGEAAERFDFSDGKTDHKFVGAEPVFGVMFFSHGCILSKRRTKINPRRGWSQRGRDAARRFAVEGC
jgi:hypothetical protein